MARLLRSSGIVAAKRSQHATGLELAEEIVQYQNYLTVKEPSMRISKKALTTVATWAEMHEKPVLLGDIPWGLKKYNIAQSNHLTNLRTLYENTMNMSHTKDITAYDSALNYICPDLLLHHNDEYMASLIHYLANRQDELRSDISVQTLFVVCGYGQSRSIPHYLSMSPRVKEGGPAQVTEYAPVYETIMSKDSPEIQVEKLVLADLLHGSQLQEGSKAMKQGVHPWTAKLIRQKIVPQALSEKVKSLSLSKPELY